MSMPKRGVPAFDPAQLTGPEMAAVTALSGSDAAGWNVTGSGRNHDRPAVQH